MIWTMISILIKHNRLQDIIYMYTENILFERFEAG